MPASPLRSYLLQRALLCALGLFALHSQVNAQPRRTAAQARTIAARFAPVFYLGLGDQPRHVYITNFDFDGDWRGDNNWAHADDPRFPFKAYIYYAVSETRTHLFIHYAAFHPQDYKGGGSGRLLSEIIGEGVKRGGRYDPTGLSAEATVAHENDMEGCLVVVAKQGNDLARARVVYVETLAHNHFLKYTPAAGTQPAANTFTLDGQRPRLYVEPKGHGIEAYQANDKQQPRGGLLRYNYAGRASMPAQNAETVGYDLLPLYTTLWPRARKGVNETYGAADDYGRIDISVALANEKTQARQVKPGELGVAFLGLVGGHNMARPPWGWFDVNEREEAAGAWFFDPASTVKRHFNLGDEFSVAYVWQPFLGVGPTR